MILIEPCNSLAGRQSTPQVRPQLLVREVPHVVGLEREGPVPPPEHGHEQASSRVGPLEAFGIVDPIFDDDEVVAL